MSRRSLREDFHWLRKIITRLESLSGMKQTGTEFSVHGKRVFVSFILIVLRSSKVIMRWSLTYFVLHHLTHLSLSTSMLKLVTATLAAHITWMTVADSMFLYLHKCSVNVTQQTIPTLHQSERLFHAKIGALAYVRTPVLIGASMGFALNVEADTELETRKRALLRSKLDAEKDLALATQKAVAAAAAGPRPFSKSPNKRTADTIIEPPRFRRRYVWSDNNVNLMSPSALYTETAPPFRPPPEQLIKDPMIQTSLQHMKDFIKVETPFNVDKLESLLHDHPNQPFVESVMKGLRDGFWPFDEGEWKEEQQDITDNFAFLPEDLQAIRCFRDKELSANRWSPPLPTSNLLPGMKISPMFVVWQHGKPRVVTDHKSSGLNDGIPKAEGYVKYDDMHPFGQALRDARSSNPHRTLITFKSDVASAFLNLPAHPLWQLRQVVVVDDKLYIVRRLVFGNRASPRCWCAVSGLLCWIATRTFNITGLHVYMDDFFGWDFADNLVPYHGRMRPRRQVQLLSFWDEISCPFEDKKQDHGEVLKIIGFFVDINNGTITLTQESIDDIISKIHDFLNTPDRQPRLSDWQRLGGHLNWVLNVLPWGRPALTELYRKTSGKVRNPKIFINSTIRNDLTWLANTIPRAIGVRFIDNGMWADAEADIVMWTDASLTQAIAFVYKEEGFVYQIQSPPANIKVDIFFLELSGILSAIHHTATNFRSPPRRLLLLTDSLDSVGVLSSLSATEPIHNGVLLAIADVILCSGIDIRVRHIDGKSNIKADMLSRLLFDEFSRRFPTIRVRLFDPPRDLLPARWRQCF